MTADKEPSILIAFGSAAKPSFEVLVRLVYWFMSSLHHFRGGKVVFTITSRSFLVGLIIYLFEVKRQLTFNVHFMVSMNS